MPYVKHLVSDGGGVGETQTFSGLGRLTLT